MMSFKKITLWILSTLTVTRALDVELTDYRCDQSLYVTADIFVDCEGDGAKCTFGESTATVTGYLHYNNVANSGIKYNVAYVMADLEIMGLKYGLEEMRPVSLCNSVVAQNSNNYDCPGDGTYGFTFEYDIPYVAGEHSTSWLASGFAGTGDIQVFAEMDESMMIGECTFNVQTSVTGKEGLLGTPSAATVAGVVLAVLAFMGIIAMIISCRLRQKRKRIKTEKLLEHLTKDDITTIWKRLDEETRSIQSVYTRDTDTIASSSSMKNTAVVASSSILEKEQQQEQQQQQQEAPAAAEDKPKKDYTPMWVSNPRPDDERPKSKKSRKPQSNRSYLDEMAL